MEDSSASNSFMAMKIFCLLILLTTASSIKMHAQLEDNTWLLGGSITSFDSSVYKGCVVSFEDGDATFELTPGQLPIERTNCVLSDSTGTLACFTNGENVYNRNYEIMEGGENFYPNAVYQGGFPAIQSYLMLPFPGRPHEVAYVYGRIKVVTTPLGGFIGYPQLMTATINLQANGGMGKVVERDILISSDTLGVGHITTVRHGNGRDWWMFIPHVYQEDRLYTFLITPEGVLPQGSVDVPLTSFGLGQVCFSPDGQWYGRFNAHGNVPDSSFSTFDIYRFDRCLGTFSDRVTKTYSEDGTQGKPGGIAFSNSSRFLYISRWDTIFQYDLQAPDILASEVVVAAYDGFTADYNLPTLFYSLQLAPDNKIYCCVSNVNSRYLHVIENPDSAGLACNVQQHSIHLPVFNIFLLPNMPYYRLWNWEDSPCDTLTTISTGFVSKPETAMRLYPNPVSGILSVDLSGEMPKDGLLLVTDVTGKLLKSLTLTHQTGIYQIDMSSFPEGIYFITFQNALGRIISNKCIVAPN